MPNGQVKNGSSHTLWVVETDSGSAIAHKLEPGRQSPSSIDADGFKAVDGTPIDGHNSWVKIVNISTADVKDSGQQITRGCIVCSSVGENEFGNITYDNSARWGESMQESRRDASTINLNLAIPGDKAMENKPNVIVKRIEPVADGFELDIRVSFGGDQGVGKGREGQAKGFTSSCSCSCATCSCTCTCGTCSCTCSCATCQCTDGPSCPAC
jgi:hypothetical protein